MGRHVQELKKNSEWHEVALWNGIWYQPRSEGPWGEAVLLGAAGMGKDYVWGTPKLSFLLHLFPSMLYILGDFICLHTFITQHFNGRCSFWEDCYML